MSEDRRGVERRASISQEDAEDLIARAVEKAINEATPIVVKNILMSLGVDVSSPISIQRDFQYLHDLRVSSEKVKERGMLIIVAALIGLTITLISIGINHINEVVPFKVKTHE